MFTIPIPFPPFHCLRYVLYHECSHRCCFHHLPTLFLSTFTTPVPLSLRHSFVIQLLSFPLLLPFSLVSFVLIHNHEVSLFGSVALCGRALAACRCGAPAKLISDCHSINKYCSLFNKFSVYRKFSVYHKCFVYRNICGPEWPRIALSSFN